MKSLRQILVLLPLWAGLFSQSLWAQQPGKGPALGVARLSLAKGDVTVKRGESGDSIQARANMPLVEGDILATGLASRAEIQLDYSNMLRLNEYSAVRLASLGNRSFRLQIERGIVTYSELRGGEADVDIETPLVAVRPEKNGRYRVEVVSVNEVIVTVQKGRAEVASANGKEQLKKGRRMIIRGADQGVEFQVAKADPKDGWDHWNVRRDRQIKESNAYRYVSQSIYGVEDLDGYGRWAYVPRYGRCWFPAVQAGWAPYRHGRWIWLDYYGWSWVSYDPWGWAPYHYGRWFHHAHFGWGWYPGSYYSHHYWRPALVAFFGHGGHYGPQVGFGLNFGHYGWIPLAPGEPYYPWYGHRHRGYSRHRNTISINNRVNIYNHYRNARHRNGVTLVDARDFSRGQTLKARSLQASEMRRASLMRGRIPVVPDRASQGQLVRRAGRLAQGGGVTTQNSFFSTRRSQRTVARNSFSQQRQEIANLVRSHGRTNSPEGGRAHPRSSTHPKVSRSAASSRTQRRPDIKPALNSSSRRSSRSLSSSEARPGRGSTDHNPGGRFNPDRTASRSSGGSPANSKQSWRRFNRRQATDRTLTNRVPSRVSTPNSAKSRSNASRSGRGSPSFALGNNSRANTRTRSSLSGSPSYVPRSSSRRQNRITTSPSRRSQNPRAGSMRSRSQTRRSDQRDSSTRQRSFSRPPATRSRPAVRSAPRSPSPSLGTSGRSSGLSGAPSYVPRSSSRRQNHITTSPSRRSQNPRAGSMRSRSQTRRSDQRDSSTRQRSFSRPPATRSRSTVQSSPRYSRSSPRVSSRPSGRSSSRVSAPSRPSSNSNDRSRAARSSNRGQNRSRSARR